MCLYFATLRLAHTEYLLRISVPGFLGARAIRYCIPKIKPSASVAIKKACERLSGSQDEIRCILAADRLECLKLLSNHQVDFMVAQPEDLKIMQANNASDVVVTHQLKKFSRRSSQRDVDMIVIIRGGSNGGLTKGKKLCYVGLEPSHMSQYDYYYTNYFESWLFPPSCDTDKTYLENRIRSLSEHFQSACIAGPWSLDDKIDAELKSKYKNLCELCNDPETCDDTDRYHGMNGAMACLTQGVGDIAWLNRADAMNSFSQLAAFDYKLLCPDGTTRALDNADIDTICTWIRDPRPVIIADKNMGELILEKISDTGSAGSIFYQVIHASYKFSYLQKMEGVMSMSDYLSEFPGYYSASVKSQSACPTKRKLGWCVTSAIEYEKCESLLRASEAQELGLRFECIRLQSRDDCIGAVSSRQHVFFVATPAEVYKFKRSGTKPIVHLVASSEDESNNIAAIVKRESPFKTLVDLKGAKACFTGYRSVGWKAFFFSLKNISKDTSYNDIEAISSFFNESCVVDHQNVDQKLPKNLYSLCESDGSNLVAEEEAFKCLENSADVAFMNVGAAKVYSSHERVFSMKYRILCPSNSRTLNGDESCSLARMNLGAVMVSRNVSKVDEDETLLIFTKLDRYFGKTFVRETPMFRMFSPYDGKTDVIFPVVRFCIPIRRIAKSNSTVMNSCKDLKQKSSKIVCTTAEDRLECLRMLSTGAADFTILEPEDLSVSISNVIDSKILITHELKMFAESQNQHDVEMIAVVKNKFDNSWISRDKRLCYIGLEMSNKPNYHYYYTAYFERWLIPAGKGCDRNKTLLENRVADLSRHFESACIAGPWSLDAAYDGFLKSKYKNLCSLCGSPAGCYETDRFYGMQGAKSCLLENVGDIAWLSKSEVVSDFAELSSYGFNLLCPDGMFIPLSQNNTCTWISEPRPTLVARSDVADHVVKLVSEDGASGKLFYPMIHASYRFSHLANLTTPLTPDEYMRRFQGYSGLTLHSRCQAERTVRWCVSSNVEARKCGWMQAAAQSLDLEPKISCIQQKDRQSALEAVSDDRCDIFVAKPDEELHARSMSLTPVAHIISNRELDASRFAAIVRKDAKFKDFHDLERTNACFSGYKSVGWNAFFSWLRNSSSKWDCTDTKAISEFFNETCVYGLGEKDETIPKNLYSLCNQVKPDVSLSPDENAFKCLMNGGDVAFVNVSAAKKYYSGFSIFRMNYRMLCQNGTKDFNEPCFIAETSLGSVLASKHMNQVKREETYLLLLSLDRFFGRLYDKETAMFTLYGPFEGHPDVIFPDKTQNLHKHVSDIRHGQSYEEILRNLQDEVECGRGKGSISIGRNILLVLVSALFSITWTALI
ncbi:hypothetical protein QAD02_020082 [Eretmocerus hayati]|uniref:Uncharacterized protein n=1 Tax=Eretmocerus hayati TaxID=131215 RepID=A0ACC2PLJ6_9HYME|nr:hypothetical protein QAD02_020082 [Eretmocerus hayati]